MAGVVGSLVYFNKMMEIFETSPELKRTSYGILKQMGWAAGGAAVGGIFGGPMGAFLGTIAGAFFGLASSDEYQSLVNVLRNMSDVEKLRLQTKIQELVGSAIIEDLAVYIQNEVHRAMLLQTVTKHAQYVKAGG